MDKKIENAFERFDEGESIVPQEIRPFFKKSYFDLV